MYSSAVVHNNRSSRVLCGLQTAQQPRGRDCIEWRGSLGFRWALGRPLTLTGGHVIRTAVPRDESVGEGRRARESCWTGLASPVAVSGRRKTIIFFGTSTSYVVKVR